LALHGWLLMRWMNPRLVAADGNGWDEFAEMRGPAWLYDGETEILN
jgi:hypothetical protein